MIIAPFTDSAADAYAEFWWSIYSELPYVIRPDGYQDNMAPSPGPTPDCFMASLRSGLSGDAQKHWAGEVTDETVVIAEDRGNVAGILIASIDSGRNAGSILSAFARRDAQGREAAAAMTLEVLDRFRRMGVSRVVATPDWSKGIEVENPIHLSLLDAGFAWDHDWSPAYSTMAYQTCLGGRLEGFRVGSEIRARVERLSKEDTIEMERVDHEQFANLNRFDTRRPLRTFDGKATFVALFEGLVIGWLPECSAGKDRFGRTYGGCVPEVLQMFRSRGVGKALYHLGMEEVVREGAEYGFTATPIHNPARMVYRSVGLRYWFTSFCLLSRRLATRA